MADVPPHLLERSRARRAALGLGGGDAAPDATKGGTSPAAPASAAVAAVTAKAPAAAPAASAKAAGPGPMATLTPPAPEVIVPAKPRIPIWAMPVLILMPLWGLFYAGTYTTDRGNVQTPEEIGATLYASNCQTCHNANGSGSAAGGIGRPLWHGEVEKTFLIPEQQVAFVRHGSCPEGTPYGNPKREGGPHKALGKMPSWDGFTDEELGYIVAYERNNLSDKPFPTTTLKPGVVPTTISPDTVCGK